VAAIRRIPNIFDRFLVVDGGSADGTLERLRALGFPAVVRPFRNHFADQRNFGCEQLGTDWIFEVDADEIVSAPLLGGLRALVNDAEVAKADCLGIPRLNFIDGRMVVGPAHKEGLDYQYRLHRGSCRWRGAVHEEIAGYRTRYELKVEDGHLLVHDKTSTRHAARNAYYGTLRP
jgi:glycosyltransferase involved in cell wall biosynthesis